VKRLRASAARVADELDKERAKVKRLRASAARVADELAARPAVPPPMVSRIRNRLRRDRRRFVGAFRERVAR